MMDIFKKVKSLFSKKQSNDKRNTRRIVVFTLFAIVNLAALTAGTIAWFGVNNGESRIDMVTGDLDVEINKVTAYKYVYPYYQNSTEFINYDTDGVVKKYVLEDHISTFDGDNYDDISITSDDATISLGTRAVGSSTTNSALASAKNVLIPSVTPPAVYQPNFRFYLIGDDTFCGVDSSWAIEDAYAFALKEAVTTTTSAVLDNVVVSAGSSFNLLEVLEDNSDYTYNYFQIDSIAELKSPFRIIDDDDDGHGDRLLCLRSGVYTFTYSKEEVNEVIYDKLEIELHTRNGGATKDISVITNSSFDPTMVTIDYAGSVNKTDPDAPDYFETIEDYLATAIHNQNTTLILDVELNFVNANPVDASLQIVRTDPTSNSIVNLSRTYEDTTHNLVGYVDDAHINSLRAADFYNFYAKFTKTPYVDVNDDDGDESDDLWFDLHRIGDSDSQKFANVYNASYVKTLDCPLNTKELDDDTVIPGIDPDGLTTNIYHCYIAIEYDYEHCLYFLNENRLGKTYKLDRDFGFRFLATQHTEV